MQFKKHLLLFIIVPLCAIAVTLSFYRFIVAGDYIVEYEGECDPITESCFMMCADEDCLETYYYTQIQKRAADVYAECGPDVTDCADAQLCLPSDTDCSVTYCSPDSALPDQACETLDAQDAGEFGIGIEEEIVDIEQEASVETELEETTL